MTWEFLVGFPASLLSEEPSLDSKLRLAQRSSADTTLLMTVARILHFLIVFDRPAPARHMSSETQSPPAISSLQSRAIAHSLGMCKRCGILIFVPQRDARQFN